MICSETSSCSNPKIDNIENQNFCFNCYGSF